MFSTNIKRSAAALAATAGLFAAAAPASHADSRDISQVGTVKGWPTYHSGLKADSNEVAVEGVKAGAGEVLTFTLVTDAGKGDGTITQARESATVTMLDYMGSPVVTY